MTTTKLYQWLSSAGAAPAAKSATAIVAAFEPVAGATTSIIGSVTQPDVVRGLTFYKTDANSSITEAKLYVTGTNWDGAAIQETMTLGAGTANVRSVYAYRSITALSYHVDGTVTGGADTISLGTDDRLGIDPAITATSLIFRKISDAAADAGTVTLDGATQYMWEPTGGNIPNSAKHFKMEYAA